MMKDDVGMDDDGRLRMRGPIEMEGAEYAGRSVEERLCADARGGVERRGGGERRRGGGKRERRRSVRG